MKQAIIIKSVLGESKVREFTLTWESGVGAGQNFRGWGEWEGVLLA